MKTKTIELADLYHSDYTLTEIFAMNQYWENNQEFRMLTHPRPTSAFVYFCGSNGSYKINNSTFHADVGSIVYIPQGVCYSMTFNNTIPNSVHSVLIEFKILDKNGNPIVFSNDLFDINSIGNEQYKDRIIEILEAYISPVQSPSKIKALMYSLLTDISNKERKNSIYSTEFYNIAPGILYLEEATEQKMSIEEIAKMCNVSSCCFRRLFKKYSGMSPIEYKLTKKIKRAKQYLRSGNLSINEISDVLEFDNPSYFCRIFKKKTGVTPKEYAKTFYNY